MVNAATLDRAQDGSIALHDVHVVLMLDCTPLSQWLGEKRTAFTVERDGASTASVAADTEDEYMSGVTSDQV